MSSPEASSTSHGLQVLHNFKYSHFKGIMPILIEAGATAHDLHSL